MLILDSLLQDERDGLRAAAAMATSGGSMSGARQQERAELLESLQVLICLSNRGHQEPKLSSLYIPLTCAACLRPDQAEGKSLSRRNGELEATVRKMRSVHRDMEGERDRLMSRIQALEAQVTPCTNECRVCRHA